jgi:hypothetical protein
MSWTATLVDVDADDIDAFEPTNDETDNAFDQFEALRTAAAAMVRSGAFGDESKRFTVHLAGHANPGHENTDENRDVGQVAIAQFTAEVGEPVNMHDPDDED